MGHMQSARELASLVQKKALSVRDAVSPFTDKILSRNAELNALITIIDDNQLDEQIKMQQGRISKGESLPLAGVPVVIKDNISTRGIRTTCASRMLADFTPVYDATVIERLKRAGAIIIAKANCDEFAMGSSNEYSHFGPVKNPWDTTRVPGGSSGGSAVAVAAGMAPLALGSDTGGSIRQPAALCGVVGFKPTYGVISRYGLVAYASSLDQIGPFARNVDDAALVSGVMAGLDERDSTSSEFDPTNLLSPLPATDLQGKRIGVIAELTGPGIDGDVTQAIKEACQTFKNLGARVETVSIPEINHALACYYVIATAEASANLARFDGVRYGYRDEQPGQSLNELYVRSRSHGFGAEVKQRIMLGTFALASGYYDAYYAKAIAVRRLITQKMHQALTTYDALLSPTSPSTAWTAGEKCDDPIQMYMSDICTISANLTGSPAVSLPAGFDRSGLPIGLHLCGRDYDDAQLLTVAKAFETACPLFGERLAYD